MRKKKETKRSEAPRTLLVGRTGEEEEEAPGAQRTTHSGRAEGEFKVADRDGAANYRIPIKTLAGFRGMDPQLALSMEPQTPTVTTVSVGG